MGTQLFDLDINAKLPVVTVDNVAQNGIVDGDNHHLEQNGLTANHQNGDLCHKNNNNNLSNNNHQVQLDLPKPSFRIADNYNYGKGSHSRNRKGPSNIPKGTYYRYQEPTPEELMNTVEYDMDQQDEEWLSLFNLQHSYSDYKVSEQDFEKIMDRLEKESYFESKSSYGEEVTGDGDEICSICNEGESQNTNVIIFCDMCDLAVHQECYGVPYVPEGQWLCRRCLQSPSVNVDCELCPNKGGAFKQTDDNKWAHVICALWVPEVCFANAVFLEPIDSIDQIPPARWKLTCYICRQKKKGACIQCHKPDCYVPFHVTCAQQAGLFMRISTQRYTTAEGSFIDSKKEAFCDAHRPSDGDSSDEDVDSHAYKRKQQIQREKMKKTRKILAEKRELALKTIVEPKIDEEKLNEISNLLSMKGRKRMASNFDEIRQEFIRQINGYWLQKRRLKNGAPLLKRLQVTLNNNLKVNVSEITSEHHEKWRSLRFELEKVRLLVGEVKRREMMKKKLFSLSREVVHKKYEVIDNDRPPIFD